MLASPRREKTNFHPGLCRGDSREPQLSGSSGCYNELRHASFPTSARACRLEISPVSSHQPRHIMINRVGTRTAPMRRYETNLPPQGRYHLLLDVRACGDFSKGYAGGCYSSWLHCPSVPDPRDLGESVAQNPKNGRRIVLTARTYFPDGVL